MPTHTQIVRATVSALRANPPDGLADVAVEGPHIRVIETEQHKTYRVQVPGLPKVSPPPSGITSIVITEWHRQLRRLEEAEAVAAAVRTQAASPSQAAVVISQSAITPDAHQLVLTVTPPWSKEQLAALRQLEQEKAERERLHALAKGPSNIRVTVPLIDGQPDLDALQQQDLDADTRAAIVLALVPEEP